MGRGAMIHMRACLVTLVACALASSSGCLPSSFDDFTFGSGDDAGAADSGTNDSGTGTAGDTGGAGNTGGTGAWGSSGRTGSAGNDAGSAAAGSGGGSAGNAGGSAPPPCSQAADCGDERSYQCLDAHCVLRRLPSGVWVSGGGGISQSANFVVRVSAGAPQPLGVIKSASYTITLGAGAGRP